MPSELFTMGAASGSGIGVGCPPCKTPTPDPCVLEGMLAKARTLVGAYGKEMVLRTVNQTPTGSFSYWDFMKYVAQKAPELAVLILLWMEEDRKKTMNPSYQCGKPWTYVTG